jgi:very-short-patch-repair endonuclease
MGSNDSKHRKRRRTLRKQQTDAEKKLWTALRNRQVAGRKFRRQHSIGPFIVDFYCHQERLIIEVDGAVHDDPYRATYDAERQQMLEEEGYWVLRFTNVMVHDHCDEVVARIVKTFVG